MSRKILGLSSIDSAQGEQIYIGLSATVCRTSLPYQSAEKALFSIIPSGICLDSR